MIIASVAGGAFMWAVHVVMQKPVEELPLGRAGMMTFQCIPMGPLWPLGLLLREPSK